jgi:hypothetical protein
MQTKDNKTTRKNSPPIKVYCLPEEARAISFGSGVEGVLAFISPILMYFIAAAMAGEGC